MIIAAALIFVIALVGTPVFLIVNAINEDREIKNASLKKPSPIQPAAQPESAVIM